MSLAFLITEADVDNLRHMVGAGEKPRDRGYRNYFAACASNTSEMDRLVEQGLATRGPARGDLVYFYATRLGAKVAGLDTKQIERCFRKDA